MAVRRRAASARTPEPDGAILGAHPVSPHDFGETLTAKDGRTSSSVAHRALALRDEAARPALVRCLRRMVTTHHASPEALERDRQRRDALARLGFADAQERLSRFPSHANTRKGNLAEIVLAEYVVAASGVVLPVYRLRFNPNVDQSMKGDDVLAFDLDSNRPRIIVGEAKFRGASTAAAVMEIVEGLARSYQGGTPASLQFVADRLFESGRVNVGTRVLECANLIALRRLSIDYVGMLVSDERASERVDAATPASLRRLGMISLGLTDPDGLVAECFPGLEGT